MPRANPAKKEKKRVILDLPSKDLKNLEFVKNGTDVETNTAAIKKALSYTAQILQALGNNGKKDKFTLRRRDGKEVEIWLL